MKKQIITVLLLLATAACSTTPQQPADMPAISNNSVVSLVHSTLSIDDTAFPDEDNNFPFKIEWQDYCSATAVSATSGTMLVTAAHCMPEQAGLGTEIRYAAPSGWGHDKATLTWINRLDDLAVLEPENTKNLSPLHITSLPQKGENVISKSSIFDNVLVGNLGDNLNSNRVETNLNIEYGWSGSPVMSKDGVFGIISQCQVDHTHSNKCVQGYATVAVLPENLK